MAAIPAQTLISEVACYACLGLDTVEAIRLALWDRIAQNGPVLSFIVRAGITDATQISALNTLVLAAKTNGWWDKCDLIYPFVGGNATAHAQNLKSSSFTIIWHGTVTHDANGITGNGTTGYGDTGYTLSTSGQFSLNSAHVGIYRRTESTNARRYFGAISGANNVELIMGAAAGDISGELNNLNPVANAGTVLAFTSTVRNDAALYHLFNGVSDLSTASASTGVPALSLFALCRNQGAPFAFSTANLAAMTAGSGLTFAEYTLMAADFQAFQTALGRQV